MKVTKNDVEAVIFDRVGRATRVSCFCLLAVGFVAGLLILKFGFGDLEGVSLLFRIGAGFAGSVPVIIAMVFIFKDRARRWHFEKLNLMSENPDMEAQWREWGYVKNENI